MIPKKICINLLQPIADFFRINEENLPVEILIRDSIGINLQRNDPPLSEILSLIDETHTKVIAKKLSQNNLSIQNNNKIKHISAQQH